MQPDLLVVCNPDQIKPTHIEGPPRLAIEILSPSTHLQDRYRKMDLYARRAVQEYWVVTPFPSMVEIFELVDGGYRVWKAFARSETLKSPSFPALSIELDGVFEFPLETDEREMLRVKEGPAEYRTLDGKLVRRR